MYRVGRKAYSHGNYIRPTYIDVWRQARSLAAENHVSLSEFVSHALFVFMTGHVPEEGKLRGKDRKAVASVQRLQRQALATHNTRLLRKLGINIPADEDAHFVTVGKRGEHVVTTVKERRSMKDHD